ncbi:MULTISPECIES: winged helix-turn-helix domain-containing protein [Prosthecochloris]|uniref:MarR family transcriptional regulator n=1 Tax=Prosthecochloris vibrioformis TaxID=1098 RepID=A0A5C4RYA0_PROVB|nr:MarR family transcriptional regulator [Prosthecochloris vibrioformis]
MILDACRETPSITIPEMAERIGITERSVQRNIQKLQAEGFLRIFRSSSSTVRWCWL